DHADVFADVDELLFGVVGYVFTIDQNSAGVSFEQSENQPQYGGFAGAGPAHDDFGLSMGNGEADLVKDDLVIEGQGDLVELNCVQRRFRGHEKAKISLLRKKSEARISIFEVTTAWVVDRPTPTVPPCVLRPARHPTMAIISPKTAGFKKPPIMSL